MPNPDRVTHCQSQDRIGKQPGLQGFFLYSSPIREKGKKKEMAELLREEEAPFFLYPPTAHTGAKKAHALESSPRLGGLQSLQPRTGVLAVEGLESLAWRTAARQGMPAGRPSF